MGPPTPTGNQLGPPTPTGRNCARENYEQKCCQHFSNRIALRGHGATNANWPSAGATHAKWSQLYQRKLRTEMLQTLPQSYIAPRWGVAHLKRMPKMASDLFYSSTPENLANRCIQYTRAQSKRTCASQIEKISTVALSS